MCGIAGVLKPNEPGFVPEAADIERMLACIAHRGPDDEGVWRGEGIGLGHRRLSIVDLSETGRQPMVTRDGRGVLSYNGEFYNHLEFRPKLEQRGVRFRGHSDTETLLYLLTEYGPEALADAAGIFSVAFWRTDTRELILARDPVGVKQLYVWEHAGTVVFASEIKGVLRWPGVPRAVDPAALNQYLHFHAPLFERTFFEGIRQVEPGEFWRFNAGGKTVRRYWDVRRTGRTFANPSEAVEELRSLLTTVVSQQLMSDVPVGAFLSGGIDSSAIATFAARVGRKPRCFGVHFDAPGIIDERPYQEAVAKAIGVDLELTTLDGTTFPDDMRRLMYAQDQPLIGAAMLPMSAVSELAARKVKVCLGGQAADEIFGGYARYALADPMGVLMRWRQGRDAHPPNPAGADATAPSVGGSLARQIPNNVRRLVRGLTSGLTWKQRYFGHFAGVPESTWSGVLSIDGGVSRKDAWRTFSDWIGESDAPDGPTKLLRWEQQTYLPGLFAQDDRMSMWHSLESRVPLADPRIVQFAYEIPFAWKFRAGTSKWILRQAVSDVLPEAVLNRRKVGFDTPAEQWMKTQHAGWVIDVLTGSKARRRGWINAGAYKHRPQEILSLDFKILWKLLCIELWAQTYIDREPEMVRA